MFILFKYKVIINIVGFKSTFLLSSQNGIILYVNDSFNFQNLLLVSSYVFQLVLPRIILVALVPNLHVAAAFLPVSESAITFF